MDIAWFYKLNEAEKYRPHSFHNGRHAILLFAEETEAKKRRYAWLPLERVFSMLQETSQSFLHEVILSDFPNYYPCRFFMDIESSSLSTMNDATIMLQFEQDFLKCFEQRFERLSFCWQSSSHLSKLSLHCVVHTIPCVLYCDAADMRSDAIRLQKLCPELLDVQVYGRNRSLRVTGSQKRESNRVKKIVLLLQTTNDELAVCRYVNLHDLSIEEWMSTLVHDVSTSSLPLVNDKGPISSSFSCLPTHFHDSNIKIANTDIWTSALQNVVVNLMHRRVEDVYDFHFNAYYATIDIALRDHRCYTRKLASSKNDEVLLFFSGGSHVQSLSYLFFFSLVSMDASV